MPLIDADELKKSLINFPYGLRGWVFNVIDDQKSISVVSCKKCKYNPKNARLYSDDDPVLSYLMCGRLEDGENGFCSNGKED